MDKPHLPEHLKSPKIAALATHESEDTPASDLHAIALHHPTESNFKAIASHPNTSEATLRHIDEAGKEIVKKYPDLHEAILAHPNAPQDLLHAHIASLKPEQVRGYDHEIAEPLFHPNTDQDVAHTKVKELMDTDLDTEKDDVLGSEKGQLSFAQKHILREHLDHEDTTPEQVNELAQHPVEDVRKRALQSPKVDPKFQLAYLRDHVTTPRAARDFIRENAALHPGVIQAAWDKFKGQKDNEEHDWDGYFPDRIAEHPSTPRPILEEIASAPKQDEGGYQASTRQLALKHPNFDAKKLADLVASGDDPEAEWAAAGREDTDEATIRLLDARHPKLKKWGGLARDLIKHPNYPLDLQLKRAKAKETDPAREVLGRTDLDPSVLKELVHHKNLNVALEALKHKSITPEVVKAAFERKAGDVSRAAAAHPMATPEMTLGKAMDDPEAAADIAPKIEDPEAIKALYDKHKNNRKVLEKLVTNPNTPGSVIDHLSDRVGLGEIAGGGRYSHSRPFGDYLGNHPNLSRENRLKHFAKGDFGAILNKQNTPADLQEGLRRLKEGGNQETRRDLPNYLSSILDHPNLDADTAKKILTGQYGKVDRSYHEPLKALTENPDAFTPEVIKEALRTPQEFLPHHVKGELVKSPELSPEDLRSLYAEHSGTETDHHVLHGLLQNPRLPKDILTSALHDAAGQVYPKEIRAALKNESLTPEDIKHFYTEALSPALSDHEAIKDAAGAIKAHGLKEHALEHSSNRDLVDKLLRGNGYGNEVTPETLALAMKNPHGEIAEHMIGEHGTHISKEEAKDLFDPLIDHPNQRLAKKAFPHMSAEGQKKMLEKYPVSDPRIIEGLRPENAAQLKITPETSDRALSSIIAHRGVTPDQLQQAITHSEEGAQRVVDNSYRLKYGPYQDLELKQKLRHMALDAYPDNADIARNIGQKSKNEELLKKVLLRSKDPGAIRAVAENKVTKPSMLASLAHLKGPEYNELMGELASAPKSPVKLLQHIAENYPEHLKEVAQHPRAASAGILKTLINKGDDDTHLALLKNEKVPEGIKDELLKNERLVMRMDPYQIPLETLERNANHDDLRMVKVVARSPKATPAILDKVVDRALKSYKPIDPADPKVTPEDDTHFAPAADILKGLIRDPERLSPEAQEKLGVIRPDFMERMLDSHPAQVSPKAVLTTLKAHEGHPDINGVLASLCKASGKGNPAIIDRVIDLMDLNQRYNKAYASDRLRELLEENPAASAGHYQKAFDKLKALRGPEHTYTDHAEMVHDGALLKLLSKNGPEKVQNELVSFPDFHKALIENKDLSKSNYDRILDGIPNSSQTWDPGHFQTLINHPQANEQALDRIYADTQGNDGAGTVNEYLAQSPKISPELAGKLWTENRKTEVLKNAKLPEPVMKQAMESWKAELHNTGHISPSLLENLVGKNPNFRLSMVGEGLDPDKDHDGIRALHTALAGNMNASEDDLRTIYTSDGSVGNTKLLQGILKNPGTPEDVLRSMLKAKQTSLEDLYKNPKIGGKLWREATHPFPTSKVNGLERGKEIPEAVFRPREDKIRAIQKMIPNGGYLDWAQFKKENPKLAGDPVVNKLFTSAPKQRVTSDHAKNYLESMPSKRFHISYTSWDGIQRHAEGHSDSSRDQPEAVFQINNSEDTEKELQKDRQLQGLYRFIQTASNYSAHPVNPQSIGWSRVDTQNPDHWFIDEVQSDFNSSLSKEIKKFADEQGGQTKCHEFGVDPEQAPESVKKLIEVIHGWDRAVVNNVIDTAKAHGVRKISIHSGASKTLVNKGKDAEVTLKYDKLYNKMPEEMGFKRESYEDLPHHNPKSELVGQPIWTLDLGPAKDPNQGDLFDPGEGDELERAKKVLAQGQKKA